MKKNNCDDCFKADVCQFKDAALEFEKKVSNLEDKPPIISVLIHCDKFSRSYSALKGKDKGTSAGTNN